FPKIKFAEWLRSGGVGTLIALWKTGFFYKLPEIGRKSAGSPIYGENDTPRGQNCRKFFIKITPRKFAVNFSALRKRFSPNRLSQGPQRVLSCLPVYVRPGRVVLMTSLRSLGPGLQTVGVPLSG